MTVEGIILHQIVAEELLWDVNRQSHSFRYWHAIDCLACKLDLPMDGKWQWEGADWVTRKRNA